MAPQLRCYVRVDPALVLMAPRRGRPSGRRWRPPWRPSRPRSSGGPGTGGPRARPSGPTGAAGGRGKGASQDSVCDISGTIKESEVICPPQKAFWGRDRAAHHGAEGGAHAGAALELRHLHAGEDHAGDDLGGAVDDGVWGGGGGRFDELQMSLR